MSLVALWLGLTVSAASASDYKYRYYNENYGFMIRVPVSLPNNIAGDGIEITLGQNRTISVYAQFDAVPYGSLDAALQMQAHWSGILFHPDRSAAGTTRYKTATIQMTSKRKFIEISDVYRTIKSGTSIIYTFELNSDPIHSTSDSVLFNQIMRSFSETRYP